MNTLHPLLVLLLLPTCMQMPAQAQIQRCTDDRGHVTYTDGRCASGQESEEVMPALNAEEQAQLQARYQQAMERRRQEQALQLQREAMRPASAAAQPAQRHPAPVVVEVAAPPAPAVVYTPGYSAPRPPYLGVPGMPPPPSGSYQCNALRCFDGKGNTWTRP